MAQGTHGGTDSPDKTSNITSTHTNKWHFPLRTSLTRISADVVTPARDNRSHGLSITRCPLQSTVPPLTHRRRPFDQTVSNVIMFQLERLAGETMGRDEKSWLTPSAFISPNVPNGISRHVKSKHPFWIPGNNQHTNSTTVSTTAIWKRHFKHSFQAHSNAHTSASWAWRRNNLLSNAPLDLSQRTDNSWHTWPGTCCVHPNMGLVSSTLTLSFTESFLKASNDWMYVLASRYAYACMHMCILHVCG